MRVESFDVDSLVIVIVLDKLWNDKEARLKFAEDGNCCTKSV
jgi:hypothetical protein